MAKRNQAAKRSGSVEEMEKVQGCDAGRSDAERIHSAVAALAAASSPISKTDDFFQECTLNLATAYQTKYAFVGVFGDSTKTWIRALAVVANGSAAESFTYELAGTPCEDVLKTDHIFISRDVAAAYPQDEMLVEMGLESYFGASLVSSAGEVLGLVVVTDTRPMATDPWIHPVLGLFADRIALELERGQAEQELQLAASVFDSSHEGIMIFGPDWRIRKVNRAFSEITGWRGEDIVGKPASVLCSDRKGRARLKEIVADVRESGYWEGELWSRQKSGGLFPERRKVSAVRDPANGDVLHYVVIISDISEQKYAEQRINRLAHYDQTTDLPNRLLFNDKLNQTIAEARREEKQFALLTVDLDGFKVINDTRGHATGDRLLKAVSSRLQQLPQESYFSARIGGDEFAILCFQVEDDNSHRESLNTRCREMVDLIGMPYVLDGEETVVTTSVGVAVYPENGDDAQTLLKHSGLAVLLAKKMGRGRFEYYRSDQCREAEQQIALTNLLRQAVTKNQFRLHFQSKHDVTNRSVVGYEALIRWQLDDGVIVSPGQFIPVAEETGLISAIGEWVMRAACEQTQEWRRKGFPFGRVSVNISGRQFTDRKFVDAIARILRETGASASDLELEITETWLMEDPERSAEVIASLRGMGFHLSIDDFGVAYSSMNYLKYFQVDTIKIDRSFTRDILTDNESRAIVAAIIAMGHHLGLNILAEGVETAGQLDCLADAGCDEAQGFFFSKPVAANEILRVDRACAATTAVAS